MTKKQLLRFIVIGCSANITNFVALILIVELFHWHPLVANILAFIIAFQVSYWGHRHWTFDHKKHHHTSIVKFLMVALSGFCATEILFGFFLHALHWYYPIAFIITSAIVASCTFFISKLWAFR